jgi:hypothetical protein
MNKYIKWFIISLLSLIVLTGLAIGIGVWLVFTPAKLTPLVRTQAAKYLSCQSEIGQVELTFFSTFPRFGLKVNHFALLNHVPNAPADTLLVAGQFIGRIDLAAWWKHDELMITELQLKNGSLNAFVDSLGKTNFDILRGDSTATDTAKSAQPFQLVNIEHVALENINISYRNLSQKLQARVNHLTAQLSGSYGADQLNTRMDLSEGHVSFQYEGENYLQNVSVQLTAAAQINLSKQQVRFSDGQASLNQLELAFSGTVGNDTLHHQIVTDLEYKSQLLPIPALLALIPPSYQSYLKGVSADGLVSSKGAVKGFYSDTQMPLMDLQFVLQDGSLTYEGFPVPLSQVNAECRFYSDMKTDDLSYLQIERFTAQTPQSSIKTSGRITHLLTDITCDLNSEANVLLTEFASMIPKGLNLSVKGRVAGQLRSLFALSQIEKMQLDQMKISGSLKLTDFDARYDSLSLQTNGSQLEFVLPNPQGLSKNTSFIAAKINARQLSLSKLKGYEAQLNNAVISLESSNVMDSTRIPTLACSFALDSLSAGMDTIHLSTQQPAGQLSLLPRKGKPLEPEIKLSFSCGHWTSLLGSAHVSTDQVKLKADVLQDKIQPSIQLEYSSQNLKMVRGADSARMNKVELNADIVNDPHQKELIQQWLVKGLLKVDKGLIALSALKDPLEIPSIQLNFDPEVIHIQESKLKIGPSDFSLSGTLSNVGAYFRKDSLLRGQFDLVSHHTDMIQLMNLSSGIGAKDSVTTTAGGPYMVPKGMDLLLNVNIGSATFGTGTAQMIKGGVRVKDGLLVLDDFDFTTPAARMQLTTLYRTPRKNHLFMGLECHMQDIEIEELLKMVPDIDSIMPMLRSFKGKGEFHMAIETYLDSLYNPKKSTIRGAASIKGQNLVLMDGATFSEIAKTLKFNKTTFNKVDSLSAEFTIFKDEIDVYPFLIVMDKYKGVVAGRHNMDLTFDYHISVVDSPLPLKFGINITGPMDDMKYRLAKCKYAEFYRPSARYMVQNKQLELRKMIRDALVQRL